MEIIFHSHAKKTHFHKKGCAPSLILIQRPGGTRKWPTVIYRYCHRCHPYRTKKENQYSVSRMVLYYLPLPVAHSIKTPVARWPSIPEICKHQWIRMSIKIKRLSLWMKSYGVTIQMKATEQYFPVVLFIMLYKMVQTFEFVDEILWFYHSNESCWVVLSFAGVQPRCSRRFPLSD